MMSVQSGSDPLPVLVFDVGGVLLDWNPRYLYSQYFPGDPQGMEHFLEEVDWFGWNLEQDAGRPFDEGIRLFSERYPERTGLIRAYDENYEVSVRGVIEGNVQLLDELHRAGYPMYVLSNWPYDRFLQMRPKFPFFDWFDGMVISGEVRMVKPDPRIFQILLEKVGRPAGECIFIDDVQVNIDAARALGFQAILFTSPAQLRADLIKAGVRVPPIGVSG